jgi:glycosyl hydrolase family 42 (putative beta-galactosidase)
MRRFRVARLGTAIAATAGLVAMPLLLEARLARPERQVDDSWKRSPIRPRGHTLLGFSLRPRQIDAFGLDAQATLDVLLAHPFDVVRIPAYWNQIEPSLGKFETGELDWQLEAVERAGKRVIMSVGAIKNFGYPEFFVPHHQLERSLPEGSLVRPSTHTAMLAGATRFIQKVVERYRERPSIVAWQLEHEAVDPLGVEHSWRLGVDFVERELDTLREADPSRPVMMNGFLPTSSVVRLSQWWRTRDQGDSLAVASRLADIVGLDFYPRHGLLALGARTLYLDGGRLPWQLALTRALLNDVRRRGKRLMVAEGQAEPWEAVTVPPNPKQGAMFSCRPDDAIRNYNTAMEWSGPDAPLYAYLFWGADYWILRDRSGDPSYLQAVARVLAAA